MATLPRFWFHITAHITTSKNGARAGIGMYILLFQRELITSLFDRPQNYKELFNYRHAQLRNHIERIFGMFKRRFRVLMLAPEYSLETQARLVPALAVLHNIIRIIDPDDLPEDDDNQDGAYGNAGDGPFRHAIEARDAATRFRDEIAHRMWRDYEDGNYRQV
jgi:hypothetical protein